MSRSIAEANAANTALDRPAVSPPVIPVPGPERVLARVPVLIPAQISDPPQWHLPVTRRGMTPAIGTVAMAVHRRDGDVGRR